MKISKVVKIDRQNRISLGLDIAKSMRLARGDYVSISLDNGMLTLRKLE